MRYSYTVDGTPTVFTAEEWDLCTSETTLIFRDMRRRTITLLGHMTSHRILLFAILTLALTIVGSALLESRSGPLSFSVFVIGTFTVVVLFFMGGLMRYREKILNFPKRAGEYPLVGIGEIGLAETFGRMETWPNIPTLRLQEDGLTIQSPILTQSWKFNDIAKARPDSTHPPRWPVLRLWMKGKRDSTALLFRLRSDRDDCLVRLSEQGISVDAPSKQ